MVFNEKENKEVKITVRFTESEKKIIDNYISENEFANYTHFIRFLIIQELRKNLREFN